MDEAPKLETVPIGKPVAKPARLRGGPGHESCSIGVQGELCVSGIGVGRGYLNDPRERRKCSMEESVSEREKHSALYRTGDLARFLPDGNLKLSAG